MQIFIKQVYIQLILFEMGFLCQKISFCFGLCDFTHCQFNNKKQGLETLLKKKG